MPFRRLHTLAIAMACVSLTADAWLNRCARGADSPQAARKAAVLDRIFANWKARNDRVDSMHFVWDCRITFKKEASDETQQPTHLEPEIFEQRGVAFWMDGDDRMCLVRTPTLKLPHAKGVDVKRLVSRWVIDERTTAWFAAGPEFDRWGSADPLAPHAVVQPTSQGPNTFVPDELLPFLLTFRKPHPAIRGLQKHSHVIDENASIDDMRCVKLQAVLAGRPPEEVEERFAFFVSPGRSDVVVHWTMHCWQMINALTPPLPVPESRVDWSIRYKKDQTCGWVPSEWTIENRSSLSEYKVTDYAVNEKIDPGVFSLTFPPGTLVQEQPRRGVWKLRLYVVQVDGSRREISSDEYVRLLRPAQPDQKPLPEKPRAK